MKDQDFLNKKMQNQLSILYIGYMMKYVSIESVQSWADSLLLEKDEGVDESILLEISLCDNVKNMISIFNSRTKDSLITLLPYYLSLFNFVCNNKLINHDDLYLELKKIFNICNLNTTQQDLAMEIDYKYFDYFFTRLGDYLELKKDDLPLNMKMPDEAIAFLSAFEKDISIFKGLHFYICNINIDDVLDLFWHK